MHDTDKGTGIRRALSILCRCFVCHGRLKVPGQPISRQVPELSIRSSHDVEFRRGNRQKHVIVKDRQIGDGIVEFGTKMISYADEVVAFGFIAGCDLFRRNLTVRIRAVAVKRTTKPLAGLIKRKQYCHLCRIEICRKGQVSAEVHRSWRSGLERQRPSARFPMVFPVGWCR